MDGKLVDIIIPVYNAEKTIEKCVESLVFGKYSDIHIILVDDCSKDSSWNICKTLEKKYRQVEAFQNEKNSGVSHTRNEGLKHITGEYLMFVDSDDWCSEYYVQNLVETMEKYGLPLTICGHHYIDFVANKERDFLWDENGKSEFIIDRNNFFDLHDKFLIQQLWNKIFISDYIVANNILFDESQSMGEDFQFIIDYMECANVDRCSVLNKPLYYYIRWNNNSLMSTFGTASFDKAKLRLDRLFSLTDGSDTVKIQYLSAKQNLLNMYCNNINNSKKLSKEEKSKLLTKIVQISGLQYDSKTEQPFSTFKNNIKLILIGVSGFLHKFSTKIRNFNNILVISKNKNCNVNGYSIISQNCIGGVFYHDMEKQFLSPTINTFIKEPDFVKMVSNLEYYMNLDIKMHWGERYPYGLLEDVRVDFMHYSSCSDALNSWNKRKARINYDKTIVFCTDRDGFSDNEYKALKSISYPYVLFTCNKAYADVENSIYFDRYKKEKQIPDLIPNREFYSHGKLKSILKNFIGNNK